MRCHYIFLFLLVLAVGCHDAAAARQRAERARAEATASKLKKLGDDMHAKQAKDSTANTAAAERQPKAD